VTNEWHPILTAQEGPTGVWRMMTPEGRQYGVVDIRRRGGDIVYRVQFEEELLGYAGSLKLACHKVYMAALQKATGRNGPPNGPR